MKKIISTDKAPAAIGPYNQAIDTGTLIFVAGQIPVDPAQGKIVEQDIAGQTRQVLENVKAILSEAKKKKPNGEDLAYNRGLIHAYLDTMNLPKADSLKAALAKHDKKSKKGKKKAKK